MKREGGKWGYRYPLVDEVGPVESDLGLTAREKRLEKKREKGIRDVLSQPERFGLNGSQLEAFKAALKSDTSSVMSLRQLFTKARGR